MTAPRWTLLARNLLCRALAGPDTATARPGARRPAANGRSRRCPRPSILPRGLTLLQLVPLVALLLAAVLRLAPAMADAPETALEAALDATVVIYSDDTDEAFLGSGFLWGDGRLAVTNQHVVGEAATVGLRSRAGVRISAPVIARDAGRDLALIAVADARLGPGLQPAGAAPQLGETVYALGAPLEAEFTATRGMVSAIGRQIEAASPVLYVQHDAAVNPGSSGGPLVDVNGRLVGMNSQIADGSRLFAGIGYAIGSDELARLVPRLADGSLRPVPQLGLRLRPVSRKIAEALGVDAGVGLLIDAVASGSIAERAGLRPGDLLLAFDGALLQKPGDLALRIDARHSDRPEVQVRRGAATLRLSVDLVPPAPTLARMAGAAVPPRVPSYSFAELGIAIEPGPGSPVISGLNPGSPAAFAGLAAGDRVLQVNGTPIAAIAWSGFRVEGPLLLLVERRGSTLHVVLDPWSNGRGSHPVGGANVLDPDVVIF